MLCGEWILVGWEFEDYTQEIKRYMAPEMGAEGELHIYEETDEMYADYRLVSMEPENSSGFIGKSQNFSFQLVSH